MSNVRPWHFVSMIGNRISGGKNWSFCLDHGYSSDPSEAEIDAIVEALAIYS
jgi:hypothetical protein